MEYKSRYALYDRETGEIKEIEGRAKKRGIKFLKVWQHKKYINRLFALHGTALRMLFYLMMMTKWGNQIPGTESVATNKGIDRVQVSKAYGELKRADIIKKIDGTYYLNPDFCWRGSETQRKELYIAWGPDMDMDLNTTKEGNNETHNQRH